MSRAPNPVVGARDRPLQRFDAGEEYEPYVGHWSRLVAREFVTGLGVPEGARWLEVGCGTGALTGTILGRGGAGEVVACEPSEGFLAYAERSITDPRATFVHGEIAAVPVPASPFDVCVSGLVLNFIPDPRAALAAMRARVRPGGTIAAYVWDYADGMRMMRAFWDAAAALDPAARELDEAVRFPLCQPKPLHALWSEGGCREVATRPIEVRAEFRSFDDFLRPFLGGQGPAPGYFMGLDPLRREALAHELRGRLPVGSDGNLSLTAVAWEVRGTC